MSLLNDTALDITLAELQNEMAEELAKHEGKWKTYREKQSRLEKHRGQTFSIIIGQCSQQLLD